MIYILFLHRYVHVFQKSKIPKDLQSQVKDLSTKNMAGKNN